ncbi:MAG: aldo/keto reductase [Clostridiales Family XIII bacterium]|jgi:aryl-alcohol dehydrogenase-like predicted oxidoreductase|nr:aldo/keto reductase [Clostridiales Family XIII bacterium]
MSHIKLGQTGLIVRTGGFDTSFLQRLEFDKAISALNRILDVGVNFIGTSNANRNSKEKIGTAISGRRNEFILSAITTANNPFDFWRSLDESLSILRTDHFEIYQFQNPEKMPRSGDGSGLYEDMLMARNQGKIRFIGISTFRFQVAREAILSGLYDILQFPFCYLSDERAFELVRLCNERGVGFIAGDVQGSGLINDSRLSLEWLIEYGSVAPLWDAKDTEELNHLLTILIGEPAALTEAERELINNDRRDLAEEYRQRVFNRDLSTIEAQGAHLT